MLLLLLLLAGLGDVKEAVVDHHEDDAGGEREDGGHVRGRPVRGVHVQRRPVDGETLTTDDLRKIRQYRAILYLCIQDGLNLYVIDQSDLMYSTLW